MLKICLQIVNSKNSYQTIPAMLSFPIFAAEQLLEKLINIILEEQKKTKINVKRVENELDLVIHSFKCT